MLGHEASDPELGNLIRVDHAFIGAGGEITKAAINWLGGQLDTFQRTQIMFMDKKDILNLNNIPLPKDVLYQTKAIRGCLTILIIRFIIGSVN